MFIFVVDAEMPKLQTSFITLAKQLNANVSDITWKNSYLVMN